MARKIEGKWVKFEYDEKSNIVFIDDHWEIETREDVDEFFANYEEFFRKLGKKFWMVAHIDDLMIHPDVADYYGEVARKTTTENMLGFVRWGTDAYARLTLRTSSMKAKMPDNFYRDLHEATQAIERMKKK